MLYNSYVNGIESQQESIYNLNNEISTGMKINSPSDDPLGAGELLSSNSALSELNQTGKNVSSASSYLGSAANALASANNILTSIQDLAIQGADGTQNASTRSTIANQVQSLSDQLITLGNTQVGDTYIFSGYKTNTAAFDSSGNFQGDSNSYQISIGSSTMTVGMNGGEVFKGTGIPGGVDVFQTVSNLITALNSNNQAGVQSTISALQASSQQVLNAASEVGARSRRLTSIQSDLGNSTTEVQKVISNLQNADLTKVIGDLQLGQVALQASMASASQVLSLNIFNYI